MGRGEDRISNLPHPILQSILAMMPLKSAIRTDVLSKKWRNIWQYSLSQATSLDFRDDFACNLSANEFVATVNRYLSLNRRQKIEKFHVFFCPFDSFSSDIAGWIDFAASRGVRRLDIDLSQGFRDPKYGEFADERSPFQLPSSLFDADSLVELSLSRCDFAGAPLNLTNFGGLECLSLSYSAVLDEEMLHSILTACSMLQRLTLRRCLRLGVISIVLPDLNLKKLTVGDCWATNLLVINSPKLQSFQYFGRFCTENSFSEISSLVDASIYSLGPSLENDYAEILADLCHVQILTLCTGTLLDLNQREDDGDNEFPIQLQNLKELQLLVDSMTNECLTCIYSFFRLCSSPVLEKLFIQLPRIIQDPKERKYGVTVMLNPLDSATMDSLKVIKVINFKGTLNEMRLVSFLLQKAIVLERMVLVLPLVEERPCRGQERFFLRILRAQMSLLSKASPHAEIILHEFGEDDGLNPTHVEIHNDNSCLPVIPCLAKMDW
ncbi:putative F-box protein [Platanthera guangdongensis]|uniref:F-box protein n=1 Tax=Platanthera guangdongensis TaxID=2320717 RepID=A0ABR2M9N7_9ASPA